MIFGIKLQKVLILKNRNTGGKTVKLPKLTITIKT